MKKLKEILVASLLGLAVAACGQPRPMQVGTDTSFYGLIAEGSKFDVTIGDSRDTARDALSRQDYRFAGTAECGQSGLQDEIECQPSDVFDVYSQHRGGGHRTIFIEVRDERVVKIGWSFTLFQLDS